MLLPILGVSANVAVEVAKFYQLQEGWPTRTCHDLVPEAMRIFWEGRYFIVDLCTMAPGSSSRSGTRPHKLARLVVSEKKLLMDGEDTGSWG